MKTEYEVRKLGISIENMIRQIKNLGGQYIGAYHQKRYVYDFIPAQKGRWIRLRTNGIQTTFAIKEIKSLRLDGTKELEISVSDFDDANRIMNKLGYFPRTFQENFRIEYSLDGVKLDIDKWPRIPPYIEIEGKSQKAVINMLARMGLGEQDVTTMDVDTLYSTEYGIRLDEIKDLCFSKEELEILNKYKQEDL